MVRIALPTVQPVAPRKGKEDPIFSNAQCRALANEACAARTPFEASAIIRRVAETLPHTPPAWNRQRGRMCQEKGWRENMIALADALLTKRGRMPFKVFMDKGNMKLPFVAFSALPFVTCPGMGDCAVWCYSVTAWRTSGAFVRQLQNTLLLRFRPSAVRAAFLKIKYARTVRLYVDGDFGSVADVRFWMRLIALRPDLPCYGYSKSWDELYAYGQREAFPPNYVLNLSSGGRVRKVSAEQMGTLSIVRNRFVALDIDYTPTKGFPRHSSKRYEDPAYHAAVRAAGKAQGLKVFSCPGKCGECTPRGHACGSHEFDNVIVAIGVHGKSKRVPLQTTN